MWQTDHCVHSSWPDTLMVGDTKSMTGNTLVKVCELSDIPNNDMRCVSLNDRNVLVAHTEEGVFVADEMCTHEDARLCDGNLSGTRVKCPLHGSRFELTTGEVLDDPADTNLITYPVTIVENVIYIELEKHRAHSDR